MEPIQDISEEVCLNLKGVFCDIDDTLTTDGKLLDVSYQALWDASRAGLRVVPVTGRPAGWVDHIARMWPVDGVVGENGAFYFWMGQGKMNRHFVQDFQTRLQSREKLERIQEKILHHIPQSAVSADQRYRESDLAIDFCEDVPRLEELQIEQIVHFFEEAGAKAKISSIHVNGWFGHFDKLSTCRLLVQHLWNERPSEKMESYIYCGDSPNDEPMFEAFLHSVGVANVLPWLPRMKAHPRYCTRQTSGKGFAEFIATVLQKRKRS